MAFRLENEYGAPCRFERMSYGHPRWVTGPEKAVERAAYGHDRMRLFDAKGNPVLLFKDQWALRRAVDNESQVVLHQVAP
jgi:peptide chain release factor 3